MTVPAMAAIQMTSGHEVPANLAEARRLVGQAAEQGAALVVLPENFAFMARSDAERRELVEVAGRGPIQDALASMAREFGVWLVGGTLPLERADDPRPANACLVFDAGGRQVARYDKIHLFDVDLPGRDESYRESAHAAPGREPVVVDTPCGRLGLSVCYDLRFPELYRRLVAAGAELLSVPAAFTVPTGRAHWEVLLRARAIESQCWVVAAAQWGRHSNGRETWGDSLQVDHWGRVVARLQAGAGVVVAEHDLEAQVLDRKRFPVLQHRVLG